MNQKEKIKENVLILRSKAGDFQAFEELVKNYQNRIFSFIYRILYDREAAEDLTQEVFLRVYRNLAGIDINLSFKNWLYKIAVNLTNDYLRKKYKRRQAEDLEIRQSPDFDLSDDNRAARTINRSIFLEEGLKKIEPRYRLVLLLYYREGFSYAEMAQKLDLPLNTVRTHLRRAKAALKKVIEV